MGILPHYLLFVPVGLLAGAVGSFVGAGGGFLMVPFLALLDPELGPETITAISLGVIFFSSASGSARHARTGRIDFVSGLMFAAATMPGAIIGAMVSPFIPRNVFNLIFGVFMIGVGVFLLSDPARIIGGGTPRPGHFRRRRVDLKGREVTWSYNVGTGLGTSGAVGFLSAILGIGGGIIHVPILTRLLNFPVHFATATSQFVLTVTALTAATVHLIGGRYFDPDVALTMAALAVGVIPGAQIGARLSERARPVWILRALAIVIVLVAIRMLAGFFGGPGSG